MKARIIMAAVLALGLLTACHKETEGEKAINLFKEYTEKVQNAKSIEQLDNIQEKFNSEIRKMETEAPTIQAEEQDSLLKAMENFYGVMLVKRSELGFKGTSAKPEE